MVNDVYTKITSPYIKNVLGKTEWSNHSYVDDLLSLEKYIYTSPKSFVGSIHYNALKKKYKEEFLLLCKEQSLERYNKEKELLKDKKKMVETDKEVLKRDWIKAGGLE
jgi:hypothetical protein